jgi:hypothetical protein
VRLKETKNGRMESIRLKKTEEVAMNDELNPIQEAILNGGEDPGQEFEALSGLMEAMLGGPEQAGPGTNLADAAQNLNNLLEAECKKRGYDADGITVDNYETAAPFTFEESLRIQELQSQLKVAADVVNALSEIDLTLHKGIFSLLKLLVKEVAKANLLTTAVALDRKDWIEKMGEQYQEDFLAVLTEED